MDYFVREFSDQLRLMNVLVESIRELDTKELYVIDVELK